ncbi:hypothetical protein SLE2022_329820 [Rubroshorea leprosula]
MADGYWNRQRPYPSSGMLKRPRTDYDQEMHNYLARDDDRGGPQSLKDTKTIDSAYDRYLKTVQLSSLASGEAGTFGSLGRAGGGMPAYRVTDSPVLTHPGSTGQDLVLNGRNAGYRAKLPAEPMIRPARKAASLPPDASNTLYVEGFPPDCTRREVAHIFRPFVGYKEVRLVTRESKHRGGDPIVLCFVDFENPACAATAMSALQGYKMDDLDPDSNYLRLQFSRYPGPRSIPGNRGRR